jgi:hypothetical protein
MTCKKQLHLWYHTLYPHYCEALLECSCRKGKTWCITLLSNNMVVLVTMRCKAAGAMATAVIMGHSWLQIDENVAQCGKCKIPFIATREMILLKREEIVQCMSQQTPLPVSAPHFMLLMPASASEREGLLLFKLLLIVVASICLPSD